MYAACVSNCTGSETAPETVGCIDHQQPEHTFQNTMPQLYITRHVFDAAVCQSILHDFVAAVADAASSPTGKLSHSKNWHQQFSAGASTAMRNHPEMWDLHRFDLQCTTSFELPRLEPRSPRPMSSFHKNFEAQEPTLKVIDWVGWRLCKVLCGGKQMSKSIWNNWSNESSFCLK